MEQVRAQNVDRLRTKRRSIEKSCTILHTDSSKHLLDVIELFFFESFITFETWDCIGFGADDDDGDAEVVGECTV